MDTLASLGHVLYSIPQKIANLKTTPALLITLLIGLLTAVGMLFYVLSKIRTKVLHRAGYPIPRFRKRDKVMFYGRKMLRKVSSKVSMMKASRGKKRVAVLKLAKRILQMKKESSPRLEKKEPPRAFLEADGLDPTNDHRLPPEVLYMLRSVRVFGHFETPLFWELCRYMKAVSVSQGQYLFNIGEADESIFVVQSGCINVFITEPDGSNHMVKQVFPGESIHSLLSLLDVLTGHLAPYKTVSAKAYTDSKVLRLPAIAFQELFSKFPESLVRIVQIITVRLQRVTFTALHNYLGLSSELINPRTKMTRPMSINQVTLLRSSSFHGVRAEALDTGIKSLRADSQIGTPPIRSDRDPHSPNVDPKSFHPQIPSSTQMVDAQPSQSDLDLPPKALPQPRSGEDPQSDFAAACRRAGVRNWESREEIMPKLTKTSSAGPERKRFDHEGDPRRVVVKTDAEILVLARNDLVNILKLKDASLLDGILNLRHYKAGSFLVKQGDTDCNLFFLVAGRVRALQQTVGEDTGETYLFKVHPGEIVGTLAVLTGEQSFFTFQAKADSIIVVITKADFYNLIRKYPPVVLDIAHTVVRRMSPFTRQIDFALDWMMVEAGCALYRQGEKADSTYIVLTGRLRSVITLVGGKKEMVGEYGRGEIVGIVESLTHTERATTVIAVRNTEVAAIPTELVNLIKRKYPQVVTRLIHLLGKKILGNLQGRTNPSLKATAEHVNVVGKPNIVNLSTVAILPISRDVPLANFTQELIHAISPICKVAHLNSEIVKIKLGVSALDSVNEFRLYNWLGQQEDDNDMVIYQCNDTLTKWTQHCMRQADCVLIVGLADRDPNSIGEVEANLENVAVRAQKELVLLHKESAISPSKTAAWLNARGWVSRYHHIQCPSRVFKTSRMKIIYQKLAESPPDRNSHFSRLARALTGTSIGLVLGGGGARGISHVGIIRALQEEGIPIDVIGGTSIGALVGGLWCDTRKIAPFCQRVRQYSMEMTSLWKKIFDLTYPITSMFSGAAFNHLIEKTFMDRQMEDLWVPFFLITTDITASKMRIHTSGSLWRYVRSSMSLAGYLPPLCDPVDGHLLLDGGYVNNLPADVMRGMGVGHILAVDVGSRDDTDLTNYGDELSGWWLLYKRWFPWTTPVKVPDMNEIQSRLAYVSCERQLEDVRSSDWCEYIRPPIDKYRTLQFGSHDEINQVGYEHGKTLLSAWSKGGLVEKMFERRCVSPPERNEQTSVPTTANFTDLAEIVSKIESPSCKDTISPFFQSTPRRLDSTTEELETDATDNDEEDEIELLPAEHTVSSMSSTYSNSPDNLPS